MFYAVGKQYPIPLPVMEGAIAEFLGEQGNILLIAMPDITKEETLILRKGKLLGGILKTNNTILLLWQFMKQNQTRFVFDTPFDIHLVKKRNLPDINEKNNRLGIEIHVVDSKTNELKALRFITLTPKITLDFLSAVQNQLCDYPAREEEWQHWLDQPQEFLLEQATMQRLGT